MCRALKVLCVAESVSTLAELERETVSADWELARGATDEATAVAQLHEERPHVLVVFGPFERFVRVARDAYPAIRVIADRDLPGASVVVASIKEVRDAVSRRPSPGGPVR
jgi:hypothetical protein